MRNKKSEHIRKLVMVAMFAALAYAVMILIHFPVSFLTLDLKDSIVALCGLYFGPFSAFFVSLFVAFMELITVSKTGLYGFLMNFLGSAVFSVTVSLVYKYKKSFFGAIIGLISGVFALTATMLLANLLITPLYMGVPVSEVRDMIPALLFPFNLVKAVLNSAFVLLLYKPISLLLQKSRFLPASGTNYRFGKQTLIALLVSAVLIAVSFVIVFRVLGGSFTWGVIKK